MTDNTLNEIIRDHAMLVSLHIRHSRLEIKDHEAAAAAAEKSGARSAAAYYAKKNLMFGADERLRRLESLGGALRRTHDELTMAWDTGKSPFRMLPVVGFQAYTQAISKGKKLYEEALDDFIENFPADARKARAALNLPEDASGIRLYPSAESLRDKFGVEVEFEPIPDGARFKNLPQGASAALEKAFESKVTRRYRASLRVAYQNIADLADNLLTNLKSDTQDGKAQRWKNSSVYNIRDAAGTLLNFSLTEDLDHVEFCEMVVNKLGGYGDKDLADLRKADADRSELIDDATTIHVKALGMVDSVNDDEGGQ